MFSNLSINLSSDRLRRLTSVSILLVVDSLGLLTRSPGLVLDAAALLNDDVNFNRALLFWNCVDDEARLSRFRPVLIVGLALAFFWPTLIKLLIMLSTLFGCSLDGLLLLLLIAVDCLLSEPVSGSYVV